MNLYSTSQFSLPSQYNFRNIRFFTDNSKNGGEVGIVFYYSTLSIKRSYYLTHFVPIVHAKLSDILLFVDFISYTFSSGKFLIISASLMAIHTVVYINPLVLLYPFLLLKYLFLTSFTARFKFIFYSFLNIPAYQGTNTWVA